MTDISIQLYFRIGEALGVSTISGSMRFREPDVSDDMEKMCEKGEKNENS